MNDQNPEIERKLRKLGSQVKNAVRAENPAKLDKFISAAKNASRKQFIRDMHTLRNELEAAGNIIPPEIASLPPLPDEEKKSNDE